MTFPDRFLWGTATAAHQVEGNNIASDYWVLENMPGTFFAEPSGDACDQYRLYRQDIAQLGELGLTSYRFSIEWARVEPEDGRFSRAAIAHYRDVLQTCHEFGITPMVTFHHFTSPRWLMKLGGWEYEGTPERFAAYVSAVMSELGPLVPYACTINEANIAPLIRSLMPKPDEAESSHAPVGIGEGMADALGPGLKAGADALGTTPDKMNLFMFTTSDTGVAVVKRAHTEARRVIKELSPSTQVGITLALSDFQPRPGAEEIADRMWAELLDDFLPAMDGDDFLGVQTYTRAVVTEDGIQPHPQGAELTQMGYEFYPEALEGVLRRAARAGLPMIVTENGVATADDSRRTEFIRRTVEGLERCLADGVDVRGYYYWSALDNYEWMLGYRPTFGLIAVDRDTQRREVKDSARYLGAIARGNGLR
ncbi:glycoside hydrolase family 1 protein [Streptomyces sp. CA-249302]|uniref:glycoside hydrolase family 1 protein n=1 Tax=Streptomyces sp. CA-249302 TaxID=3240058 RepID=UPI003D916FF7